MSHSVTIKAVEVRNPDAIMAAARRLNLPTPQEGLHKLFDGTKRQGHAVQLPNWNEKTVFDTKTGEAIFDNYNGAWGDEIELDRFVQAYSIEQASIEARANGYGDISEEVQSDGSVQLTLASY